MLIIPITSVPLGLTISAIIKARSELIGSSNPVINTITSTSLINLVNSSILPIISL